jgi:hypothetical protein
VLEDSGFEIEESKIYLHTRLNAIMRQWKKLAFLKNWGQMRFIVRKANTENEARNMYARYFFKEGYHKKRNDNLPVLCYANESNQRITGTCCS